MSTSPSVPERIARLRKDLQASDPLKHRVRYRIERWRKYLRNDPSLEEVDAACAGTISRRTLATLGRAVGEQREPARDLFLATMIWGFGPAGYGPYRTREMLKDLRNRTRLEKTVALLAEGRLEQAYTDFRVAQCGPAFFTKFFYAVGLGFGLDPLPLVLDSRVAEALETLQKDGALDMSQFVRGERSVARYLDGYLRYVDVMHAWAATLRCRADAIELLLFKCPPEFAAPLATS